MKKSALFISILIPIFSGCDFISGNGGKKSTADYEIFFLNADPAFTHIDKIHTADKRIETVVGDTARKYGLSCSPDGSRIVYIKTDPVIRGGLYVADSDGRNPVLAASNPWDDYPPPAWREDGMVLAFTGANDSSGSEIYTVNIDGSDLRQLTRLGIQGLDRLKAPSFCAQGSKVAFQCFSEIRSRQELCVVNADGTGLTYLTANFPFEVTRPLSSFDGTNIAFSAYVDSTGEEYLALIAPDGSGLKEIKGVRPDFSMDWSPDDAYVVLSGQDSLAGTQEELFRYMVATGKLEQLTRDNIGEINFPTVSRDGLKIAYTERNGAALDLHMIDSDGSGAVQLTTFLAVGLPAFR